jgi:amidase
VPAGFAPDGLPRGVQLVGKPNDEATLMALAAQLEAARPATDGAAAGSGEGPAAPARPPDFT